MLKYDGNRLKEVRVSDFGLSILLDQTAYAKTIQIGTPNYMAPVRCLSVIAVCVFCLLCSLSM